LPRTSANEREKGKKLSRKRARINTGKNCKNHFDFIFQKSAFICEICVFIFFDFLLFRVLFYARSRLKKFSANRTVSFTFKVPLVICAEFRIKTFSSEVFTCGTFAE
jgi:hypothetical protein